MKNGITVILVIIFLVASGIFLYGYVDGNDVNKPSDNETNNQTESKDNKSDNIIDSNNGKDEKMKKSSNDISDKKFEYNESANLSGNSGFTVKNVDNEYKVTRTDTVPNPAYNLFVKEYRVKDNKLVIIEDFVDNSPDNMAAPSVISQSGYEETFNLDQDIDHIIIYHPFGDKPYVRQNI